MPEVHSRKSIPYLNEPQRTLGADPAGKEQRGGAGQGGGGLMGWRSQQEAVTAVQARDA